MNIIVMGRTWAFAFFVPQNLENQFPVEDHAASSGLVIVASIFVALSHEVKLQKQIQFKILTCKHQLQVEAPEISLLLPGGCCPEVALMITTAINSVLNLVAALDSR